MRPPADPEHTVVTLPCMEAAYRRIWIEISHKHKKQRVADNQANRPMQPAAPHRLPIWPDAPLPSRNIAPLIRPQVPYVPFGSRESDGAEEGLLAAGNAIQSVPGLSSV